MRGLKEEIHAGVPEESVLLYGGNITYAVIVMLSGLVDEPAKIDTAQQKGYQDERLGSRRGSLPAA